MESSGSDNPPKKELKPHRCDNRLEDLIESLFEGDLKKFVPGPAKLYWKCLHSKPGEEPTEPYFFVKVNPPPKVPPRYAATVCWFSSLSEAHSVAVNDNPGIVLKFEDVKLMKAIAYEADKGFCNSAGKTKRFGDFLGAQLSRYVTLYLKGGYPFNSDCHNLLVELEEHAKLYNELNVTQRTVFLDRVSRLLNFSGTRELVEHQTAVAEANQRQEDVSELELPSIAKWQTGGSEQTSPIVYGSSEPVELFNPSRKRPVNTSYVSAKSSEVRTSSSEEESADKKAANFSAKISEAHTSSSEEVSADSNALDNKEISRSSKSVAGSTKAQTPNQENVSKLRENVTAAEDVKENRPSIVEPQRVRKVPPILQGNWKLDTLLQELKCLTPYQKSQLDENGFYTARSLLNHFPRSYIDFESGVKMPEDGQSLAMLGTIVYTKAVEVKAGLVVLEVIICCTVDEEEPGCEGETKVFLHVKRFLRGPRLANSWFLRKLAANYPEGSKATVCGKVKAIKQKGHFEIKDYDLKLVEPEEHQNDCTSCSIYPAKGLLQAKKIQQYIKRLLASLPSDIDPLPVELKNKYQLLNLEQAYLRLHSPKDSEETVEARRRIVFDDFFYLQLAFLLRRRKSCKLSGYKMDMEGGLLSPEKWSTLTQQLLNSLPFKLTAGQIRATSEIMWDLRQPVPMGRLLQGDVGCGKTIVAFLALLDITTLGYQGAFMAPTEFLASQHYTQILSWLELLEEKDRPRVALLTGSVPTTMARHIRQRLEQKEIDIIIGTQSLISGDSRFAALGLAVIDEQHRFGVIQRDRLKSNNLPEPEDPEQSADISSTHILAMSATPIPRSLALTVHGDMTMSQITDVPRGRHPPKTVVFPDSEEGRNKAYEMVLKELENGGRAFIVCPLINDSPASNRHSAVTDFKKVSEYFSSFKCGLVHGRLKTAEREEEMEKFRDGEYQILVTTTVIEVGIDIPEASVMLVENAERYGIAQLHQLRGRVGRGKQQSMCIFLSSIESSEARLKLLESSTDGFYLSEADLKLRGPGDLLGKRQSGRCLDFVLARLGEDNDILEQARAAAEDVLEMGDDHECLSYLKHEINVRQLPVSWS